VRIFALGGQRAKVRGMPRTATLRRPDQIEEGAAQGDSQPNDAAAIDAPIASTDNAHPDRHALGDVGYGVLIGLLATIVARMLIVHGW
jgi:hypothetical protein